ncbi:MAG TPA: DUF72 domain-containing protein [Candidatus Bathyarchaeia archaeon]|nr:DUF72 domain-containing protein [Candidatus Bathyarchaeia archaeon]
MGPLHIGAGGWSYFFVSHGDRLKAYSSAYDFVEVNSTYYRLPTPARVASWRRRVPPGFEFSLRCHRDVAELYRLESTPKSLRIIDSIEKTCRQLQATILTILIPATLVGSKELAPKLNSFLSNISVGRSRIAIEFRGGEPTEETLKTLQDHDAMHSVDISRQDPKVESNSLYSRLFGNGSENAYEFDDNELQGIAAKASGLKFEKSILAFHGVRMYRDAARLKTFLNSGRFPSLTGQVGLESLREVLEEDTEFPTSRSELISKQGWKLYDKTPEVRARVASVLEKLPEASYMTLGEVLSSLKESSL